MNGQPGSLFASKVLMRQSITSVRLVIALFCITSSVTKLLYDRFLPSIRDFDEIRWAIIILGVICFAYTWIQWKRAMVVTYFSLFLYVATILYLIAFVLLNKFDPNAVTMLILVLGSSTVIINSLFYYGIQCAVIVIAAFISYSSPSMGAQNLIAFQNLLIALGVFGIVIAVRLRLISNIEYSYSNLEKLNVLSIVADKNGGIVFVSPSAQNLLGYKPKELMNEGWWRFENLRNGWINREYIQNYPNIFPKEIASMETSLVTREGKVIWLNWVNSMLPNGNYVGVGLDITPYKQPGVKNSADKR